MEENLIIVESPAKAKTIMKFLGKDYLVKSSYGHIRDLSKKNLGIDLENKYAPDYIVSADKKKVVAELKKQAKDVKTVWLASDEDREGEAIAWHLMQELKLDPAKTKRIVFHEITKDAVTNAIKNPRDINIDLVNAQQARRVLDRLVGFELSPVLWKKIKSSLSAGRVQSVAVKLIVEREREIAAFISESKYRVYAVFSSKNKEFKAELNKRFDTLEEAVEFLELCKDASFKVNAVNVKPGKKSPAPPFTTSTLQQEAARKLNFSVSQTMRFAQSLYESGKITYMRTDSVNLSSLAISTAKAAIIDEFGEKYSQVRQYQTKSKGAQEAHEAIRPTFISTKEIDGTRPEQRLYELIWKRTVASQMANALTEKTHIEIEINNSKYKFITEGEVITFDGFLKLYLESDDEDDVEEKQSILPKISVGEELNFTEINAMERYAVMPSRYNEAGLVKKMEDLGIGRPSTYAPTISTIQQREYVIKETRKANEREVNYVILKSGKISQGKKTEKFGYEKSKLFPTSIGMVVTDYLTDHFPKIMDYNFTAKIEKQFDEIAVGEKEWTSMIDDFYKDFHSKVEASLKEKETQRYERTIGVDPKTGKNIVAKIGRYGAYVQIGDSEGEETPKYASLRKDQNIETITLEEAIELFKLPRDLGEYKG
ncbi:MAG: type I DNA topoisomerase, partial [Bacteroidales bacterium]|nr:type I DNA topoisomerase [Bacteroidales bacterium]